MHGWDECAPPPLPQSRLVVVKLVLHIVEGSAQLNRLQAAAGMGHTPCIHTLYTYRGTALTCWSSAGIYAALKSQLYSASSVYTMTDRLLYSTTSTERTPSTPPLHPIHKPDCTEAGRAGEDPLYVFTFPSRSSAAHCQQSLTEPDPPPLRVGADRRSQLGAQIIHSQATPSRQTERDTQRDKQTPSQH